MKKFTVHIPEEVEAELRRCRASIRASIRKRLDEIVHNLTAHPVDTGHPPGPQEPPHRFYVFEGYRVSYRLEPVTRRVVVTKLQAEKG